MSDGTIYGGTTVLTELSEAPSESDRLYLGDMSESTDADKNKFIKIRNLFKFMAEQTVISMEYSQIVTTMSGELVIQLGS